MKNIIISLKFFTLIISAFLSFNAFSQTQTFTSSGSFTVPAGVTTVTVQAWGGGGGGGSRSSNGQAGGGGGGAFATGNAAVTQIGSPYAVVVGTGGGSNSSGSASTFNTTTIVAAGGTGGTNNNTNGGAGGTAAASTGTTKYRGGNGSNVVGSTSGGGGGGAGTGGNGGDATTTGGTGTATGGGSGGNGRTGNGDGNPGNNYGAGGGGASRSSGTRNGGSGADGRVILSWTCPTYSLTSTSPTSTCAGSTATVTINGSAGSLPVGSYTVTYNLGSPNTATGITKTMTVSTAGTGSFTTDALNNSGTTLITITNLTSGSCSSAISTNRTANITVNALPTITSTTPGSRNGIGTVPLSATASAGTINWYAASTGGASLFAGANFTTPSISTTTTYYASTTNGSCTSTPRVAVVATVNNPEIDITGKGISIIGNGTNTPSVLDDTDFDRIYWVSGSKRHTFTINNTGALDLNLTGASPFIVKGGTNPGDFTLDITGMLTTIPAGGSTTFDVVFDPSAVGVRTATLSIANNDPTGGENPYVFNLKGTGTVPTFTDISVSVTWPSNSEFNRVEVFSPSGVLLTRIDNGYSGGGNTSYSTTVNLSCIEEINNYYYVMYDINNNGWDGSDNIRIFRVSDNVDIVNTNDGNLANLAGYTRTFNVSGPDCVAEIDVKGNSKSIIGNGTNSPTVLDHTHFGNVQIVSETKTRTFRIYNLGGTDLTIGNISLSGHADFSIVSKPAPGTILGIGGTANVQIAFTTINEALETTILTILSSGDVGEETYTINLSAQGTKVFFDSDGDGIYDDVDIDDDNDGIIDSVEENNCRLSSSASQADYKFLNETFGVGTTRGTGISNLYSVYTNYCLEDGNVGSTCSGSDPGVGDGEYTVSSQITSGVSGETVGPTGAIAAWAWYAWAPIQDHTPGDTDGRMAIFNASYAPGVFYETEIKGTISNVPISYSFWVINIDAPDINFINQEKGGIAANMVHRILPNVTVNFWSSDKSTLIATFDTGDITRCGDTFVPGDHTGPYPHASEATYNQCATSVWQQFSQQFTTADNSFIVQFVNNAPGGAGNDLAIDDIEIRQTLCDMDSDGVADVYDLDADDDGIPDVVEANPTAASLSQGKGNLTGVAAWVDANGNGMLDSLESLLPIDTDGDGIPDYLDLDSDNDGLFDVDESGVINTNDLTFQNGDGDITGDGTGDGPDSETFREKDSNGDGIVEGYGDGILDIYDFHEGNTTYPNSYGNNSQGTGPLYALDSDGDGIPNYRDPYNNLTLTYDIDTVEIYASLPHTAGILNSLIDFDGDGIMASRDGNDAIFGSPRNLNLSYSLYFDGRNDYVEDANVISSGSATLMAFIKSGGANTSNNNRIIAGQNDFHIRVNNGTNTITAIAEGITLTSTSTAPSGIWMHVAVTTTAGKTALYINGVEEANNATGTTITSASNFMIGRATTNTNYFKGEVDEVRVFNKALTADELKRMVYQELDDANSFNRGKIIPIDISASIGTNLVKYYKMDGYKDDVLDNKKTAAIDLTGAKMYNIKDIYFQRAPLPYVTNADGNWTNASSWLYGNQWDITTKQNNPTGTSIVNIKHNINLNGSYDTQGTVGIIVDAGKEFSIEADKGLYNSWYLKLNGLIDLDNESQLIQTQGSILDVTSAGKIERDQQGTKDLYTYNYWSSPVGVSNTISNNNSYRMIDNVLKNGTLPATPNNITFLTSGYDGSIVGTDIRIADYWIWKYTNNTSNTYANWQHVRRTGTLLAGEGFSMKGVANTGGSITQTQNYVFNGKPNNGDITLSITAGNDYLVGNPYPSALNADEFIKDNISNLETNGRNTNGNIINGTLYFWDHFASNTHALAEYQGGYATYTLMGGAVAVSNDTRINATGSTGTKTPKQYIPVSQGFFVSALLDPNLVGDSNDPNLSQPIVGGNLLFKNSQRVFQKEAPATSIFIKNSNSKNKQAETTNVDSDIRQKIRLKFDSPKGYHRQLLVGVDENASNNFDMGYDAPLIENNVEDLFWVFNNNNFIIQAVNNFDAIQTLPLGVKINKQGIATIKIDALENVEGNTNIYIHDKQLNTYHDLKESNYEVYLTTGNHLNRFEVTFAKASTLNTDIIENSKLQVYFSNENKSLIIHNPALKTIESVDVLNVLGQSVFSFKIDKNESYIEYKPKHINTGAYVIKLKTDSGIVSKKVLIE